MNDKPAALTPDELCPACEGRPAPGNNPCYVCGYGTRTSKEESPVVFNLRQIAASDIARWDIRNHIAAAADEIERLTRELAAERALRIEAERYAEGREEHNITLAKGGEIIIAERDRLWAALEDIRDCKLATQCGISGLEIAREIAEKALSAEPNSAVERQPAPISKNPTLLRCPFCGADDPDIRAKTLEPAFSYVHCERCGAQGPSTSDEPHAESAWNNRTSDETSARQIVELDAEQGFEAGWRAATAWTDRDDLLSDIGSSAYHAAMTEEFERMLARKPDRHALKAPETPAGPWPLCPYCKARLEQTQVGRFKCVTCDIMAPKPSEKASDPPWCCLCNTRHELKVPCPSQNGADEHV